MTRVTEHVAVPAADGCVIDVRHAGGGTGSVVVCQGGTPSGLAEWPRLEALVEQAGLGLVAYARPGYAASSRREGRTVASAADDTRRVLDHLGVDAFVAFGVSGGGPHALADAAGVADRCQGAAVVAGLAPMDAPDLDFFDSMADNGQALFHSGRDDPAALAAMAEGLGATVASLDAATFKATAPDNLPPVDAAVLQASEGEELAEFLAATTRSAFSHGPHGMIDDVRAFTTPWGLDLATLACPLTVWHGTADENVPVAHGRWIVDHVPEAEGRFLDGEGHVSILRELPSIIEGLAALAHR